MDEALVSKSYRSILFAWAISIVWALAYQKTMVAVNITLGTVLGTVVLATYDVGIRRILVPGAQRPGRAIAALMFVKYVLIGFVLYRLVRWEGANLMAFCGGIVLVHAAIFAKLAGLRIVEKQNSNQVLAEKDLSAISGKES